MGNVITNLKARFGIDSSGMSKGLAQAGTSLGDLDRKVGKSVMELQNLMTPLALLGAAGGGLALLKSSIEAVNGPADKFEAIIGGGKEALWEMQRAIATMDFKGFITAIAEGYDRGKDFAELLDELADKKAYDDYVIIGLQQEADALREVSKNKQLEITERADAADKIKAIELQIFTRRKELLEQSLAVEKNGWEGRNKVTIEEGVKLFEDMTRLTKEGYNDVSAETINSIKDLYDSQVKAEQLGGASLSKAIKNTTTLIKANILGYGSEDLLKNIPKDDLNAIADTLAGFTKVEEGGEADAWVKLFDLINNNARSLGDAQRDYNSAIAETTKLLAQEDKLIASLSEKEEAAAAAAREAAELERLKAETIATAAAVIANLQLPDFSQIGADMLAPMPKIVKAIKEVSVDISDAVSGAFENMGAGLGEFLGQLANGSAGVGDFGKLMAASFADLAITVGKITIQSALAVGAIDAALKIPGAWPIALAAGVALVAIGTAVRGALSNAASGTGGGGASMGGGGYTYDTRAAVPAVQKVQLTGTVEVFAKGSELRGAMEFESNRRNTNT